MQVSTARSVPLAQQADKAGPWTRLESCDMTSANKTFVEMIRVMRDQRVILHKSGEPFLPEAHRVGARRGDELGTGFEVLNG